MKITQVIETRFDKGDNVIFNFKDKYLMVGVIEGFNIDDGNVWYNIRVNKNEVFSYGYEGDIAEWDIKCKLTKEQENIIRKVVKDDIL